LDSGPFSGLDMADDKSALTDRELEIVRAVATGATNQQIARDLQISVNTVKVHLKNIFAKLEIQSRTEVALYAVKAGLVEVERPPAFEDAARGREPAAPEPISRWKRVLLVAAVIVAALLVWLPRIEQAPAAPSGSDFEDEAGPAQVSGPPLQLQRWSSLAPMPTARSRLAAVYHEGLIYAIGGDMADGVTGAVEIYDTSANGWHGGSAKPVAVNNVGAAVLGGRIFVPGGYSAEGEVIPDLEVYDPQEDSWEGGSPMPVGLCAYALAVADDKLYLFGGWDGAMYVASTYEYDPLSDKWSEKTPMPSARGFLSAAVVEGKIYVVGGYDGERELATVEEYDPAQEGKGEPWREVAAMSLSRGGLGVAAIAGSLYAVGGGWNGYLAFNERYDPRSDQWSTVETPIFGQWRNLAVVASETRLYALGGWNGDFLEANNEYRALFTYYMPEVR
jgi:DNA-binding CsgD family transcriptional regulator/N-acetylneuraminic acid mutarotase